MTYFSSFVGYIQNIRATDSLFSSNLFQSLLIDGKSMSFQLYCLIKGLILDTL